MSMLGTASRGSLVLSPHEPLVAGGAAEQFERHVQLLFRQGHRHLVVDLRHVSSIDSAGVRAFVRGHTTAQRMDGTFRLFGAVPAVLTMVTMARLDSVLEMRETLEDARKRPVPWPTVGLAAAGGALVGALVWGGIAWPVLQPVAGGGFPGAGVEPVGEPHVQPFVDLFKLVAAAGIGLLVTIVSRRYRHDKPQTQSMEQAQVLLCVSGAMMMVIIGSSIARAFGIAGAAAIIRFRTPVEDPKDITILFLLMGLGMAAGLGAFATAGLATAFLCLALVVLDRVGARKPRLMTVELKANRREFPATHVESVFARHGIVFEPREISQGGEAVVQYQTKVDPDIALDDVSQALMGDGTLGLKSVSWEQTKRKG